MTIDEFIETLPESKKQEILRAAVFDAAYLNLKAEWAMEDNFSTTEDTAGRLRPEVIALGVAGARELTEGLILDDEEIDWEAFGECEPESNS